jgi:hypothetical protein
MWLRIRRIRHEGFDPQGMSLTGNVPWGKCPLRCPAPAAPVTSPPSVEWKEGTKRSAALLCMLLN